MYINNCIRLFTRITVRSMSSLWAVNHTEPHESFTLILIIEHFQPSYHLIPPHPPCRDMFHSHVSTILSLNAYSNIFPMVYRVLHTKPVYHFQPPRFKFPFCTFFFLSSIHTDMNSIHSDNVLQYIRTCKFYQCFECE